MSTFIISGCDYVCFKQTVNTDGADITINKPVKTFIVKAVGGQVRLKRLSTESDTDDVYLIEDREVIGFDLKMPFTRSTTTAPLGTFKAVSSSVDLYFIVGY